MLNELAKQHGSDKADFQHNYTAIYELLLRDGRERIKNVLEIGVLKGASVHMWQDYFPNAMVYGIDIHTYDQCPDGRMDNRIQLYWADQSKEEDLLGVMEKIDVKLDLIVDDGSHKIEDQVVSFKTLLPFLNDKGIYVIEDIREIEEIEPFLRGYNHWYAVSQDTKEKTFYGNILAIITK